APADTLLPGLLTCPYVLWDAGSNTLTFDFGDGCEDAHGQMHSGSIEISYNGSLDSSATLSITFNDYMMDDEALSGSLTLNVTPDSIRFIIQDATISSPEGTFIVNADLTVNVELNNPVVVTDDVFFLLGTFSVVDAEAGANFALEITDPVRIQTNCPYPTSGKVDVSGGDSSGTFAATADFFPENGACDNVVVITIGTATRKVQL
ncbi:MAG: hypothetical protein ACE5HO_20380, partial [bacterium]